MPHANIWIRGENWEHWKTISNKSEIVNAVLDQSRKTGLSFPEKVAEKIKVGDVLQGDTPRVVTKIESLGKCPGVHDRFRANCGREGCPY
jgi:hypothetical protein